MPDEVVFDASVAAKVFIQEAGSEAAAELVASGVRLIAPELVLTELTNVAVKRLRRLDIPRNVAERMVSAARSLFDEIVPAEGLLARAFVLAADHGLSTYDAMYVTLAEQRGLALVTADARMIKRLVQAGSPIDVRAL